MHYEDAPDSRRNLRIFFYADDREEKNMACFVVPVTEAVVTTIAAKVIEKKENKAEAEARQNGIIAAESTKERFSAKLKRLNYMLWGGSGLLAFEHLWHGEIQPFFPFLTAAANPVDTAEMLHEMATVGVSMAVIVTAVWGVMTFVTDRIRKKSDVKINVLSKETVK